MDVPQQYKALTEQAGWCRLPRTQVELTGGDRVKFLHGMCTNDIQALTPGTGCEAFLTSVQGKVAAYVYVFCGESSLVLDTVAGQAESIIGGLDRYLIREDVELHDRSQAWSELLVAGPAAPQLLGQILDAQIPPPPLGHLGVSLPGSPASLRRVPYCGPSSFFLSAPAAAMESAAEALQQTGAVQCAPETVEIVRIETGTPLYGQDITADNLPQEVDRNEQAIHFNKGCYLGQETVARIDALGHVNRTLAQLRFSGTQVPPAGTTLVAGEKTVARVTSACWSYREDAPLALAYVRRGHNQPGTKLSSDFGEAEVKR